jgi:hypothetical protein
MQVKKQSREREVLKWHRVKNKKAIRLLREYKDWKMLEPFIDRATTLSEAAKQAQVSLRKMYSFAQQLLRASLIRVVKIEPRKGRSLKYYRAVASHFFIAFEDLEMTLEENLKLTHRKLEESAHRSLTRHIQKTFDKAEEDGSGVWGRVYGPDADGSFSQLSLASENGWTKEAEVWLREDIAPFITGVGVLKLSYEQVRNFRNLFNDLNKKYLKPTGDKTYYISLRMVELERD